MREGPRSPCIWWRPTRQFRPLCLPSSPLSPGRQAHWSPCRRRAASTPSTPARLQPEPSWGCCFFCSRLCFGVERKTKNTLPFPIRGPSPPSATPPRMATSCTASRQCRLPRNPLAAAPAPRRRCVARAGMRQAGHHADRVATADVLASDGTVCSAYMCVFCGVRKPVETKTDPPFLFSPLPRPTPPCSPTPTTCACAAVLWPTR